MSPELLSGVLVAVVGGGGLWAYLGSRGQTKADLITIAQDAATAVIHNLHDEMKRLQERVTDVEAQHQECQHELAALRRMLER